MSPGNIRRNARSALSGMGDRDGWKRLIFFQKSEGTSRRSSASLPNRSANALQRAVKAFKTPSAIYVITGEDTSYTISDHQQKREAVKQLETMIGRARKARKLA
jgi:hypothetical protein